MAEIKWVPNTYAGKCTECGSTVGAQLGERSKTKVDGRWLVRHVPGECQAAPVSVPNNTFAPSDEQVGCVDLFRTGESMVITAGAGTGKTSTLRLIAQDAQARNLSVIYLAFNTDVVKDVTSTFPSNVKCSTVHAVAWHAIGKQYKDRLDNNNKRRTGDDVARILGIEPILVNEDTPEEDVISARRLGAIILQGLSAYCKTTAIEPSFKHIPYITGIDPVGERGKRTYVENKRVAKLLEPALKAAWKDVCKVDGGKLGWVQEYYLKLWFLSKPTLNYDVILFDEAQDANPIMAAVVNAQEHAQIVYVGDEQQEIYGFTGAVNAMAGLPFQRRQITKSFRFGPAIANEANNILSQIDGAELRITGYEKIDSTVGVIDGEPDAILTRTNAAALSYLLDARSRGIKAALCGKNNDLLAFVLGARELQQSGTSRHQDLAVFDSWAQAVAYSKEEEGADLKLWVDLVEKFTVTTILDALNNMPSESEADLIISTAHKSKGREWDKVLIGSDFVKPQKEGGEPVPPTPEELRLRYVAVTRAKKQLDCSVLKDAAVKEAV